MNFALDAWQHGWQIVGWTMLSFLAVGSIVLVLLAMLRFILTRAQPQIRYATTLAGFAILALLPVAIAGYLTASRVVPTPIEFETSNQIESANPLLNVEVAEGAKADLLATESTEGAERTFNDRAPVISEPDGVHFELVLQRTVDYLPWLWVLGTPLTFLLLASGLIGAERMRTASEMLYEGPLHEACQQIRIALRVGRDVGIAVCDSVVTPLLVGVVRPLILLPPAAVNGWTTDELEMVLVHELTHVRRWDNAVNLAQRVVESLLFFHPAVWIVSAWVRRDREDCCDAVVVAHTAKPQAYAELLVALAANQPLAGLATSAMARHPLASRIRRILKLEDEKMLVSRKGLFLSVSTVIALILCASFLAPSEAEEATASRKRERPEVTTNDANDTKKDLTTEGTESTEKTNSPFPTLEEQRDADIAYKLLGVELEILTPEELARVKAKGFAGGLRVTTEDSPMRRLRNDDLLVGLHVWPTESLEQVQVILSRDDLKLLSPLKFYVIRSQRHSSEDGMSGEKVKMIDYPATGRIQVDLDAWRAMRNQGGDAAKTLSDKKIDGNYKLELQRLVALKNQIQEQLTSKETQLGEATGKDRAMLDAEIAQLREIVQQLEKRLQWRDEAINDRKVSESSLLYDGKTFDQWRNLWKTELKTEKRIECINALAAFGRAGKGPEAAEAILDVAAEFDFGNFEGSSAQDLKQAISQVLAGDEGIYGEYWLPQLMERLKSDPAKWSSFAEWVLEDARGKNVAPYLKQLALDPSLSDYARAGAIAGLASQQDIADDAESMTMVREVLTGDDPKMIPALISNLNFIRLDLFPEQAELLVHKNAQIRNAARGQLRQHFNPTQGIPLLETFLAVIDDPTRKEDHAHAIEALGLLSSHFNNNADMQKRQPEVVDKLTQLLIDGDVELLPATLLARSTLEPQSVELLIRNLGDMISAERRQQLEKAAEKAEELQTQQNMSMGGSGGMGGGGMF